MGIFSFFNAQHLKKTSCFSRGLNCVLVNATYKQCSQSLQCKYLSCCSNTDISLLLWRRVIWGYADFFNPHDFFFLFVQPEINITKSLNACFEFLACSGACNVCS